MIFKIHDDDRYIINALFLFIPFLVGLSYYSIACGIPEYKESRMRRVFFLDSGVIVRIWGSQADVYDILVGEKLPNTI